MVPPLSQYTFECSYTPPLECPGIVSLVLHWNGTEVEKNSDLQLLLRSAGAHADGLVA